MPLAVRSSMDPMNAGEIPLRRHPFARTFFTFLFLAPLSSLAALTVSFNDPGRYADAGEGAVERQRVTQDIERHLQGLAQRYLPPEQALEIEVLDIDLAGRTRFLRHSASDVRVLDGGADWPAIKLRYSLRAGTRVLKSAEETVSDMNYLRWPAPSPPETLHYEKRMLETWFRDRFAADAPR
jgi:hypothetical protein